MKVMTIKRVLHLVNLLFLEMKRMKIQVNYFLNLVNEKLNKFLFNKLNLIEKKTDEFWRELDIIKYQLFNIKNEGK